MALVLIPTLSDSLHRQMSINLCLESTLCLIIHNPLGGRIPIVHRLSQCPWSLAVWHFLPILACLLQLEGSENIGLLFSNWLVWNSKHSKVISIQIWLNSCFFSYCIFESTLFAYKNNITTTAWVHPLPLLLQHREIEDHLDRMAGMELTGRTVSQDLLD